MLYLGTPRQPIRLAHEILQVVRRFPAQARVLAGFAYANLPGVEAIRGIADSFDWTNYAQGRWILGIANGVTEPRAIRSLLEASNQKVRLFVPRGQLSQKALLQTPRFHAKLLGVEAGRPRKLKYIWAGSANATSAAMGRDSVNFEAAMSLVSGGIPAAFQLQRVRDWWEEIWAQSLPVTPSILNEYSRIRGSFRRTNPGVLQLIEPPAPSEIRRAGMLWIEAGAMSGGARNQIEFNENVAAFFGAPQMTKRFIEIEYQGRSTSRRPLTPKLTSYGVRIWRLGLPTEIDYRGKVVHLRRLPSLRGHRHRFALNVAEKSARSAIRWYGAANESGYVGWTRSAGGKTGRQYGLL